MTFASIAFDAAELMLGSALTEREIMGYMLLAMFCMWQACVYYWRVEEEEEEDENGHSENA